jgi:hypothetical protein
VHCDLQCPPWDGRDEIVAYDAPPDRTDRVVVLYNPPGDETAAIIAQAHDRLAAAGWRVHPLWRDSNGGQQLEASHDGLNIRIDIIPGGQSDSYSWSSMDIVISKDFTVVYLAGLIGGAISGLVGGWLLTVWILRRWHCPKWPRRAMVVAGAVPVLVVGPLSVLVTAVFAVGETTGEISPRVVQTPMIAVVGFWQITAVTVASGLLSIAVAVFPVRSPALPMPNEVTG